MRIADMAPQQGFEMLAKIAPYAAELMQAGDLKAAKEGFPEQTTGYDVVSIFYPALIGGHLDAVLGIAAALTGCTLEEMRSKSTGEVLEALKGETMKEVYDFFPFARGLVSLV